MDVHTLISDLETKILDLLYAKDIVDDRKRVEEIEDLLLTIQREAHKIERGKWKLAHYEMMSKKKFYDVPEVSPGNEV